MERISITIDEDLLGRLDAMQSARGYTSRSEAIRDILREHFAKTGTDEQAGAQCVAALTYVYDHHTRDLAARLADAQHHRHDLTVATMHVHLDHESCLETTLLKGTTAEVRAFADGVISQRGVRFGHLHTVPADIEVHGHGAAAHTHVRV